MLKVYSCTELLRAALLQWISHLLTKQATWFRFPLTPGGGQTVACKLLLGLTHLQEKMVARINAPGRMRKGCQD